jgi:hypothetical protein
MLRPLLVVDNALLIKVDQVAPDLIALSSAVLVSLGLDLSAQGGRQSKRHLLVTSSHDD